MLPPHCAIRVEIYNKKIRFVVQRDGFFCYLKKITFSILPKTHRERFWFLF